MIGIDYGAVVQDLQTKQDAMDQIIAGFQRLLGLASTAVRVRGQLHAGNGNGARPHAHHPRRAAAQQRHAPTGPAPAPEPPRKAAAGPAPRGKFTPEKLTRAKMLYEQGVACEEIGRQVQMSGAAVVYQAEQRDWKRRAKVHLTDPGYRPGVPE